MSLVDKEIGRLIRKAREHLKLSIENVAEELGITPDMLLQLEFGEGRPTPYQLLALCAVLRVQPSWFFPEIWGAGESLNEEAQRLQKPSSLGQSEAQDKMTSMLSEGRIEVSFPGNVTVFVGRDFDEAAFRKVVAVLRC